MWGKLNCCLVGIGGVLVGGQFLPQNFRGTFGGLYPLFWLLPPI